jgi:hypothetical protein
MQDSSPLYLLESNSSTTDEEYTDKPVTCWQKFLPQVVFLVFGIGNAVTTKMAIICEA